MSKNGVWQFVNCQHFGTLGTAILANDFHAKLRLDMLNHFGDTAFKGKFKMAATTILNITGSSNALEVICSVG